MWLAPPQDIILEGQIAPTTHVLAETRPETVTEEIERVALENGVKPRIALKVASCESGLRQFKDGEVLRGEVNHSDVGLFQINEHYHLADAQKLGIDIYTVSGNIEFAMRLMAKQGTTPWLPSSPCWLS